MCQHSSTSVEDESSLDGGSGDVVDFQRLGEGRIDGATMAPHSRQRKGAGGASRASLMKQVAHLQALVVSMQEAMAADAAAIEVPVVAARHDTPKLDEKA